MANANAEAAWPDRNEVVWHLDLAGDRHAVPVAFRAAAAGTRLSDRRGEDEVPGLRTAREERSPATA